MLPETNYDILVDENLRNKVKAGVYAMGPPIGVDWDLIVSNRSDIEDVKVEWDENPDILNAVKLIHLKGNAIFINPDFEPRMVFGIFLYIDDGDNKQIIASEDINPVTIDGVNNTLTIPVDLVYGGVEDATS